MSIGAETALATEPSWSAYAIEPSSSHLGVLLHIFRGRDGELLELLETEFHRAGNWRTAQHLAMCYSGAFPSVAHRDLVRAFYFARQAVGLSDGDFRARLALARIHWERRIPLGVTYEVDLALAGLEQQADLSPTVRHRVLGECANLRGLAWAYLGNVDVAFEELQRAEAARSLTLEAALQLLSVAETGSAVAGAWAAARVLTFSSQLGGHAQGTLLRAWRRQVLVALHRRADDLRTPRT